jgi:glucose-1-phosphate thymidylyltransferase
LERPRPPSPSGRTLFFTVELSPSARGELEITAVNRRYMELKKLNVVKLGRGYARLDTGTHDAMLEAAEFVRSIQGRQGLLVGCPDEVALLKKFITANELRGLAAKIRKDGLRTLSAAPRR